MKTDFDKVNEWLIQLFHDFMILEEQFLKDSAYSDVTVKELQILTLVHTLGTCRATDIAKNKNFGIYPNPAKEEFFIKAAPTVGNATIKVEILDMNGKLVKSFERKKNSSDSISTKGLLKGTYLVVITDNGKSDAEKLIIE